jgi:hypothetical protein
MTSVGPTVEIYAAPRSESRRRVEKANMSSRLEDDRRRAGGPAMLNGAVKVSASPSRIETISSTNSLVEGIPTGFIAQILGQILVTKRADLASSLRAYERTERDLKDMRFIRWA